MHKLLPESRGSSGQQDWPENRWNEPHDLDNILYGDDAYKLMDPGDCFSPFAVPVNDLEEDNLIDDNKEGPQKNITPIPLPQEFQNHLSRKARLMSYVKVFKSPLIKQAENSSPNANKIGGDHANEDMENELEAAVQEKFREWLLSSGRY